MTTAGATTLPETTDSAETALGTTSVEIATLVTTFA